MNPNEEPLTLLAADGDQGFPSFPSPGNRGLWLPNRQALECRVLALVDQQVLTTELVPDVGRHDHLQEAHLALHGVTVDLAHVPASVGLLHLPDAQLPDAFLRGTDADAVVLGDDLVLDGEDGLGVHPEPGHLVGAQVLHVAAKDGLPSDGHCGIDDGRTEFRVRNWKGRGNDIMSL